MALCSRIKLELPSKESNPEHFGSLNDTFEEGCGLRRHDTEGMSQVSVRTEDAALAAARGSSGATSDPQNRKSAQRIASAVLGAIFLLYVGLIPLGQWQADEYDWFSRLKLGGWQVFATRMHWTLRPWEALFVAYGMLVNHFHRPLTGWFLGLLWAGFLFCAVASAITERGKRRQGVLLSGLGLAAAFLTSGPLFQLFYWPVATVVYLPILSATLLLFIQTMYGAPGSQKGRLICAASLVAAAFGGEIGATFVICYAILQGLNALWIRGEPAGVREKGRILYWLLPCLLAVAVMVVASRHRLGASEGFFTVASPELHHPVASAAAAIRSFALELVGLDAGAPHRWLAAPRVLSRLLVAAGVALVWKRSAPDGEARSPAARKQIVLVGATLLVASLAVLFGSYLHFGTSAGERLETLRRCWIVMAYVAAAILIVQSRFARRLPQVRRISFAGPLLLVAGVAMPWHVSPLIRQYETYKNMECTTVSNFESGLEPGTDAMTFALPPTHGVITPLELEPGIYTRTTQSGEFNEAYAQYVLEYFGKQSLTVVPNRPCRTPATGLPVP